ncbi:MAG: hypothetical protein Kow0020_15320 [Wenzhouxiangellaceae bacterium]
MTALLFMLAGLSSASGESYRDPDLTASARGAFDCGDLYYDDGSAENAIFFGGGQAGDPDHFLGVRFELADFGLVPGQVELRGFCVSNQFDFSAVGGPWPNQVYVYPDRYGLPDLDHPQREATMWTGDGTGRFELDFQQPWTIDAPVFWIMVRGAPQHAGEDFNVETDQSSEPAGKSWITDRGLDWIYQTEQNLMIRAKIGERSLPAPAQAVPVLGRPALFGLVMLLLTVTLLRRDRPDARRRN